MTDQSGSEAACSEQLVVLGKVLGAYGVKGWIRIQPFGDDPLSWRGMPEWWFAGSDESRPGRAAVAAAEWQSKRLRECRMQGDHIVASVAGVDDRQAAEAMRGLLFGAPRRALPETGPDEYYWGDLLGLPVHNEQGALLGTVNRLIETGANDVLVVLDEAGQERLLPFVEQVVLAVEVGKGIRVDWGLDW